HDPFLAELYGHYASPEASRRWFGRSRPPHDRFDHLLHHSDAEGFYVPVDFDGVLHCDDTLEISGLIVGSSQRLLAECIQLRDALAIPADLDPEDDALWAAPR